jgi:large subunit ribosomal protein L17
MRHGKKGRKLKRTASHKKATLIALSTALLRHKKIRTTVAKAKETKSFVERIITRAKNAVAQETESGKQDVHSRREVYRSIKDRALIQELFAEIAPKVMSRSGGYTRVVKLGQRHGDGASLAILELVDFNVGTTPAKTSTKEAKAAAKQ